MQISKQAIKTKINTKKQKTAPRNERNNATLQKTFVQKNKTNRDNVTLQNYLHLLLLLLKLHQNNKTN